MSARSNHIRLIKAGEAAERRRQEAARQEGEPTLPLDEPAVPTKRTRRRRSSPPAEGNRVTTIFGGETKLLKLLEKRGGSVTIQIGPPQADETDHP